MKITQHLPASHLGRNRIGFSIDLGDTGFNRFINTLPHGQAEYHIQRREELKAPVIEVMMPGEYMDKFDLENLENAVAEMYSCSLKSMNHTTSYLLSNVVKAVMK